MSDPSEQKVTRFAWKKRHHEAAKLLAEDELTDAEIAAKVGVVRKTIYEWRKHPEFSARVKSLSDELGDIARRYAIGRRARRARHLDDRIGRMHQVIRDRAADPTMQEVPGGPTGLMVRTIKQIGSGENARVVEEYAVDTGLLKELREHEKQAAQEFGQWEERHSLAGVTDKPLVITIINVHRPHPVELNGHAEDCRSLPQG